MANPTNFEGSGQIAVMASVQEKVQERIRQQLADLIPEEMWKGLVADATKKFIDQEIPSIVKEELTAAMKRRLSEELNKPEWRDEWLGHTQPFGVRSSEMIKQVIKDCAPELVSALFASISSSLVMNIRNGSYGRF